MGVVAMKTLRGAKHRNLMDFQPYADSYAQAALRWVLANRDVSCAVISFYELQHVDEYLYASGKPLGAQELAVLEEYERQIVGSHCAPHCGKCLDRCPEGVPIHDVLRHRMYFEDYGWEKEGMQRYAELETEAREYKARIVGDGGQLRDVFGQPAEVAELFWDPANPISGSDSDSDSDSESDS